MDTLLSAALILLPLVYLLVVVDYGLLFFGDSPRGNALALRAAPWALRGALALHLAYLLLVTWRYGQFPAATVAQALSVVAFALAAVYALVEWREGERSTGFWMVGLVFFCQLLASLLNRGAPPDLDLFHSPLFAAHVALALTGYVAFLVAAAYGFLFLELYRELKAGRFELFFGKLPPLEVLEKMMNRALLVGFVALTGAVTSGALWARQMGHDEWLRDPKILFTSATWLLYGLALLLRRLRRWQGRQTALASLAGLAAIFFSLLAVNFLFTGFHGFW